MNKSVHGLFKRILLALRALFLTYKSEDGQELNSCGVRAPSAESPSLIDLNRRLEKVELHQAKLQEDVEKITSVVGIMSESLLMMVVQTGALYHELGLDPAEALNIIQRHVASDSSEDDMFSDDKGNPKNGGGLGGMVN